MSYFTLPPIQKLVSNVSHTTENILGYYSSLYGLFLQLIRMHVCECVYLGTPDSERLHCHGLVFTEYLGLEGVLFIYLNK